MVYFIRDKGGSQMGMKTEGKEARTVEYKNNVARIYNPGPKCFDTVRKAGIDTYLTLGFGSSGKDLAAHGTSPILARKPSTASRQKNSISSPRMPQSSQRHQVHPMA